ncbi:hypothetical protein [Microbacterium aurum]
MDTTTDVLLIPGFWLDAASWDDVVPTLRAAGLAPRALTMPGVGAEAAAAAEIGLADWIARRTSRSSPSPGGTSSTTRTSPTSTRRRGSERRRAHSASRPA